MIITISGTPGSGKSTVAKILKEKLVAQRVYVGGIRRELAREKGMTLEELNQFGLEHPETDIDVDEAAAKKARELANQGDVLVEGRTQYHFLPESLKIYITVDFNVGAERIWKDMQQTKTREERNEGNINSIEEMKQQLKQRIANDTKRYQKYYEINPMDESQYDFVLDTSSISAAEAAKSVLDFIASKR